MKNSEHHTIKSLKLWENHHNTHTGGGGVLRIWILPLDPLLNPVEFFFSLWTYSPRTGDLFSRVEVDSLTDWLHGAFR